jgi:protein ImuA
MSVARTATLADLRQKIENIDRIHARARSVLPFDVPEIDAKLPGGGLALGALHEIAGGAQDAVDGAASAAFTAGIAARTGGIILWCYNQSDLFEPALARFGLTEDRVIFFKAPDETAVLAGFEYALRHGGPTAVVGELAGLSQVNSQRLQLAAETSGTMALALRRWRRHVDARDFGNQTTSFTRWRVTEVKSERLPVRGVGRARWQLELMRARGGRCADFEVEATDVTGHIFVPAILADGSVEAGGGVTRAVS